MAHAGAGVDGEGFAPSFDLAVVDGVEDVQMDVCAATGRVAVTTCARSLVYILDMDEARGGLRLAALLGLRTWPAEHRFRFRWVKHCIGGGVAFLAGNTLAVASAGATDTADPALAFRPAVHLVDLATCSHAGYLMAPGAFEPGSAPHVLARSPDGSTVVVSTYVVCPDTGRDSDYGGLIRSAYHVLCRRQEPAADGGHWEQRYVVRPTEHCPDVRQPGVQWSPYAHSFTMRLFQHDGRQFVHAAIERYSDPSLNRSLVWHVHTGAVWTLEQVPADVMAAADSASAAPVSECLNLRPAPCLPDDDEEHVHLLFSRA
jgi:hypothetical protein